MLVYRTLNECTLNNLYTSECP
eukprot:SAG22_NODE_1010_length_6043_cov_2.870962_1_plen_21_part_10